MEEFETNMKRREKKEEKEKKNEKSASLYGKERRTRKRRVRRELEEKKAIILCVRVTGKHEQKGGKRGRGESYYLICKKIEEQEKEE